MTKRRRANNDQQSITQKTKHRATRTPLNTVDELMCYGRVSCVNDNSLPASM
jgi:hypothetical protein